MWREKKIPYVYRVKDLLDANCIQPHLQIEMKIGVDIPREIDNKNMNLPFEGRIVSGKLSQF